MALENLSPIVREERLLAGEDLEPANRLEYFLKQAGSGGSGSVEYDPVLAETTKSVNEHGWTTSFSGGPIFEGTSYRVTVNGVTYEPLIGTAGELGYICLGNTYVDDADPSGDYDFGIFYKDGNLTAWLETGESITMQIDQIIQLVPVPSPAAADTGKVLTANNGAVEWKDRNTPDLSIYITDVDGGYSGQIIGGNFTTVFNKLYTEHIEPFISCVYFFDGGDNIPLVILQSSASYDDGTPTLYITAGIGEFTFNSGAFIYTFNKALVIIATSTTVSVSDFD